MISGGNCVHVARAYTFKREKGHDLGRREKYDRDPFITRPVGECVNTKNIDAMKTELSKILLGGSGKGLVDTIRKGVQTHPLNPGVVAQYNRANDRVDIDGRSPNDFTSAIYLNNRLRHEKIYFPILELIATDKQGDSVTHRSFEQALNEVLKSLTVTDQRNQTTLLKPEIFLLERKPW